MLYVDDILVTTNCEEKLKEIKENLIRQFEITDFGVPKKFLGIEIVRDKKNQKIFLYQGQMVTRKAEKETPTYVKVKFPIDKQLEVCCTYQIVLDQISYML